MVLDYCILSKDQTWANPIPFLIRFRYGRGKEVSIFCFPVLCSATGTA